MEAFKPDEEPDDAYSVIGFSDPSQTGAPPEEGGPPPPPSAYPPRPRPCSAPPTSGIDLKALSRFEAAGRSRSSL